MNPFEPETNPTSSRTNLIVVLSQAIFSVSSLLTLALSLTDRIYISPKIQIALAVIGFSALYVLAFYFIVRRIRRVKRYEFRLAVTGLPRAGKTVFSIVVFDALMNARIRGVVFSTESRTLISVYQAIRNLPAGTWPKSTSKGNVSTYEGTVSASRIRVDLEVGDSSGDYWLDFNNEETRDPGYLEYVISAHGIAHVIPLHELMSEDCKSRLSNDVDDLRLVSRLKRNARGGTSVIPLLIVLSQADKAIPIEILRDSEAGLLRVVDVNGLTGLGLTRNRDEFDGAMLVSTLRALAEQLDGDFLNVRFTFSSAPVIAEGRLGLQSGDLLRWIMTESTRPVRVIKDSRLAFIDGRNGA